MAREETAKQDSRPEDEVADPQPTSIVKPKVFSLDRFKSKLSATIANVGTLQTALPCHRISGAKDFVRLHPNEGEYWSPELCFVNVPTKGMTKDTVHLIEEEIAMRFLQSDKIMRHKLALATKPYDAFFLCQVPTQNLENVWNQNNVQACEQAKVRWCMVGSRRSENVDGYQISYAHAEDAFPEPKWPSQSLSELIEVTFAGRMITDERSDGLLRLIGAKPSMS